MPHHVYANNDEIASKSADGKSVSAFPDVCISPGPPPPPGGIPVPYPNTCYAKDLTRLTKTVMIKGKGAALENYSYFSRSTGDEQATLPLKRGVVSSNLMGKCFFKSWSMNVKAEGKGVARHMDLVTHNHGSPPNTPPIHYVSIANLPASCKRDRKKMEDRCGPKKKKKKKGKKSKPSKGNWVRDHCGPLMVKPGVNFDEWMKEFGDLDKLMKQATDILKSEVIQKLEQEIAEFAAKKAVAFAARRGLTGWIPVVGWVISAADLAYTGYEIATNLADMKEQLADLKNMVSKIQEATSKVREAFDKYADDLKNFKNLPEDRQKKIAKDVMETVQTAYGSANPCMRARKCFLVPYSKTKTAASNLAGKGCCPGQTGHHVLPDAMFRDPSKAKQKKAFEDWKKTYNGSKPRDELKPSDMPRSKKPKRRCWGNYTENGSPTICLEGGATTGSHGAMHKATKVAVADHLKSNNMDYDTARDRMVNVISKMYGCNKKCLKAQLDGYYKKKHGCPGEEPTVTPHSGLPNGGPKTGTRKRK